VTVDLKRLTCDIHRPFAGGTTMHGDDQQQAAIFSYLSPEERVPPDDPLHAMRLTLDAVLKELSAEFDPLYPDTGRLS
jgi:hypothetical protein